METERILNKLGVVELNAMQDETIHAFRHSDKDLILLSPTGSGKTLAYLLPLAEAVDASSENVQALVVVPGRELALQAATVLNTMQCGVKALAVYGGRPAMDEHRMLREVKPQIIFGTPGRLNDHLHKGNIPSLGIIYLFIDEFDKCLEMGFRGEMKKLAHALPNVRRRMLISATDAPEIPDFISLGRSRIINCLDSEEQIPERVTVNVVRSPEKDKLKTLDRLLRCLGEKSSLVFVNHRESVERVAFFLRGQGFVLSSFHGGLDQKERESELYKFINGSANVMVSTDLASRGLDIPDVANIIHYHLPESEDSYVHRVGRTARWDKTGNAFFIVAPGEQVPDYVEAELSDYVPEVGSKPVPKPLMATLYIGKGKKDKISKHDLVGFLCKQGGLDGSDIGRIDVKERFCYAAVNRSKIAFLVGRVRNVQIKGVRTIIEVVR